MKLLFRLLVTAVSGISSLYFFFWVGGTALTILHAPFWIVSALSVAVAIIVGRYVWAHTAGLQAGLISSMFLGALTTGGIGFAGGFFGPIIFMPGANQGPLLGIFITGPLGFVLGGIGGAVYWRVRGPKPL